MEGEASDNMEESHETGDDTAVHNGDSKAVQHNTLGVANESHYVIDHRDPLYNRAELSCLWELNKVSSD